ncbi:integrase domain-containing protein [Paraburkholderia bengalensis]|uniref:Integrase domain-containing protein n=1 Tax=Paraburkholderia bengalensis TaxID=2747562 RepID=A0ABU8J4I4_9BURK
MTRFDIRSEAGKPHIRPIAIPKPAGWRALVQEVISPNVKKRVNGRVASHRTQELNSRVIFHCFNTWHQQLGMRIMNPYNLAEKHIAALVRYWYEEQKAASTMRNDLSILRKFCGWLGKPNLVKPLDYYLPGVDRERLKVSTVANKTKSWSANGVDLEAKLKEAFELDHTMGMLLSMQLAFGLRKKEALCVRPWVSDQRDLGHAAFILYTRDGTKGGRQRLIPIEFEFQVRVLDYVKAHTAKRNSLGWRKTRRGKDATLKSNLKEYEACMGELGMTRANGSIVTGHGLRAEFAENCALLEGFVPGTLGGRADQLSREDLKNAQVRVSERLGHSSSRKTLAYYGNFKKSDGPAEEGRGADVEVAEATSENVGAKGPMWLSSPFNATVTSPLKFINTYYQGAPEGRVRPTEDAPPVVITAPLVNRVVKRDGPEKAAEAKAVSKPSRQPMPDPRLASVGENIGTSGSSSGQYPRT